ncbi:MAG TPA: hypothetical protein VGC97_12115 [Pyrinomonadaceae bacterium]|jgi:hypothetical protein
MLNKSKKTRLVSLILAAAGFVFAGSYAVSAQTSVEPFKTPDWKKKKTPSTPGAVNPNGKTTTEKKGPPPIVPVTAPAIEMRINYYKQQREAAAANGMPIPKVTSVLTLDEMAVTGIFKTSRGFAAMVEATPIKLSYTIYPGEKFFDGQLVAIEENRLVFRKVVKMTNNKFISSVENKTLRQYTVRQEIEGTVPTEANTAKTEVVNNNAQQATTSTPQPTPASAAQTEDKSKTATPTAIVSPVDEMNKQPESKPEDSVKDKNKKNKKPTKVAKKS